MDPLLSEESGPQQKRMDLSGAGDCLNHVQAEVYALQKEQQNLANGSFRKLIGNIHIAKETFVKHAQSQKDK